MCIMCRMRHNTQFHLICGQSLGGTREASHYENYRYVMKSIIMKINVHYGT